VGNDEDCDDVAGFRQVGEKSIGNDDGTKYRSARMTMLVREQVPKVTLTVINLFAKERLSNRATVSILSSRTCTSSQSQQKSRCCYQ
jgi:hypothetical protein